jgi:tight adherence protein B
VTALAAFSGCLVLGGIWIAITSWRTAPQAVPASRWRLAHNIDWQRLAATLAAAIASLVLTRWPVAAVAGGWLGWLLSGVRRRNNRQATDKRTEAIAMWAEMLRDAIGTSRGVEGVLVATAATAPLPIRAKVQTMARRLQHEPLDQALDGLAADLDHPIGDLVVMALRLTSTSGGRQVRDVLSNLAAAAYAEAESQRRIAVARQRPRAAMQYTAVIIGGFVALLVVFSRTYLEPYDSAIGQVVLVVVALYWTAGFWWMHRMGRTTPVERFLQSSAEPGR